MSMPIAHARQTFQNYRIQQGVDSGELTRAETQELRGQQREIRGAMREARADGQVTCDERQQIRQLQNQASQDIYQAKHDCERRGSGETPRVDRRQARQEERIANGVKDGSLTKGEAAGLNWLEGRVQNAETRAKSDGVVTPAERQRLESLQDMASRAIFNARHNAACRP